MEEDGGGSTSQNWMETIGLWTGSDKAQLESRPIMHNIKSTGCYIQQEQIRQYLSFRSPNNVTS